ncbi:MAG TPA: DUF4365 domain-containing protein, partial [bacterium]|nr:DUF4365 domain-containing protein [bacterium]
MPKNAILPQKTKNQQTGELGEKYFPTKLPSSWHATKCNNDYGLDFYVEVTKDNFVQGLVFGAQIKSHQKLTFIENNTHISETLDVSNYNYLLEMSVSIPIMLCVCDASKKDPVFYYTWLDESNARGDIGVSQKTLSIPINIECILTPSSEDELYEYIISKKKEFSFTKSLINHIVPPENRTNINSSSTGPSVINLPTDEICNVLKNLGVIDINFDGDINSLSKSDRITFQQLKDAKNRLNNFEDGQAYRILHNLSETISSCTTNLQAFYNHLFSVYYYHCIDLENAIKYVDIALRFDPNNIKYKINSLLFNYLSQSSDLSSIEIDDLLLAVN